MILTELYQLSKRLESENEVPVMYGKTKIRWLIPINTDGTLRGQFTDLQGASKAEQRGKEFIVPDLVRSSGIKPKLLADNGEYVLGLQKEGANTKKVAERHNQFKELIQKCADETQNPAVLSVVKFFHIWNPETFSQEGVDPADNFTFEVYGIEPNRPVIPANAIEKKCTDIQQFWAKYTAGDANPVMTCLVTGELRPVEIRLPVKIKGIPNGQTAGTSLVSANAPPFTSYGLENSLTSPISREAGEGFGKALNHLIATKNTHLYLGPVVYTFWAKGNVDVDLILDCFEEDQPEEVRNLFNSPRSGQRQYSESDRFYALGLSASGGRAVVRNWIDVPIQVAQANLDAWWDAQKIVNEYGQYPEKPYLKIRSLLNSIYRDPSKEINVQAAKLIEIALKGGKIPLTLLGRAVQRIRVEHQITHHRAAMIKLILTTHLQTKSHNPMKTMTELNLDPQFEDEKDTIAYHCGRLLAQLENIQKAALGNINTTLIDRYYSAASSTPGKVFGELIKDAQAHLRKLRVTKPGVCEALQQKLEEVIIKLPANIFPDTLTMQQQSIFALGYYQQRAENRREAIARKAENEAKKADAKAASS
jgi:CRISPR-associated protein Csd1